MNKRITSVVALILFFAATSLAIAGGVPMTKTDCLAAAEKYEKLAADQEAIVQEHTQMKKDYRSKFFLKGEREKALADMDKHCDAIIAEAKKLADTYKAMAQWHKMHAEHMKE